MTYLIMERNLKQGGVSRIYGSYSSYDKAYHSLLSTPYTDRDVSIYSVDVSGKYYNKSSYHYVIVSYYSGYANNMSIEDVVSSEVAAIECIDLIQDTYEGTWMIPTSEQDTKHI